MKLFFRKYVLIIIFTILIYFSLYIFKSNNVAFLNIHLLISILIGLLIRLFDDYIDYEKDLQNKKAIFDKKFILVFIVLFYIFLSILFIYSKNYLYFSLLVLFLINLFKNKTLNYIKSLYIPLIIFCFSYY